MTFNVSPGQVASWANANRPKASMADIAMLEASLATTLPATYVDFVSRYGFVIFGDDVDRTCLFSYSLDKAGQREIHQYEVSFLFDPQLALRVWRNLIDASDPDDESLPSIPQGYFPIGNDPGQGCLLIELATGRIRFWRESEWRWGMYDNTQLGVVSDTFEEFINGLRADPL